MSRLSRLVVVSLGLLAFLAPDAGAQGRRPGRVSPTPGDRMVSPVETVQRGPSRRPGVPLRGWRPSDRRGPSEETAAARGYSDGYRRGLEDGRGRNRYDPVRHGTYRTADAGYDRDYGTRDAYRNNYRSGFRQGYEDGYRDGPRGRR